MPIYSDILEHSDIYKQQNVDELYERISASLQTMNIYKCMAVVFGRNISFDSYYKLENGSLHKV